jgi:hypothetical protein
MVLDCRKLVVSKQSCPAPVLQCFLYWTRRRKNSLKKIFIECHSFSGDAMYCSRDVHGNSIEEDESIIIPTIIEKYNAHI